MKRISEALIDSHLRLTEAGGETNFTVTLSHATIQDINSVSVKKELIREFVSDDGRLVLEVRFAAVQTEGRSGPKTVTLHGVVTEAPGDYMPHRVLEAMINREFVGARLFDDYNAWFNSRGKVFIKAEDWKR